jgi:TctA family transporter
MIAPIVMNFKSPEMLFLVIMGISFIAVLTGDSVIKGVISGALGIIVSLIGMHTLTGIPRFTFGSVYLYNGLSIPTVVMGLFGLSEMMDLVLRGQATISKVEITKAKFGDVWVGVKDVFHHWGLWLRCCIVGYIIGVIPGVGPGTAQWLAYGQAKQTSKMRAEFGSGCVEGVIAPQAGNSASPAGDLLTTMAFGIPGSTGMAVLMGGFFLVGLTPGPVMMTKNLDLVFTLLLGVVIANIMAGLLCVACSRPLARVAFIHMDFLYPVIVAIIFIAAYVGAETMLDLVTVIVMGFIGLFMNRFGYSRPAFALGFVMGELFEYYFFRSVLTAGRLFFLRPVCLIMVAILVGLFGYRPLKPVFLRLFRR